MKSGWQRQGVKPTRHLSGYLPLLHAAPADLGRYCSGCYGRVFHEDGLPLVLGDPADPWREFNAEAEGHG